MGFPSLKDILDYENERRKILGEKYTIRDKEGKELFVDIPEPTAEQQREAYYSFVLGQTIDEARYRNNKSCAKAMKKHKESWKPHDKQIEEGTFEGSTVKEEYRMALKEEMKKLQDKVNELQAELEALDGKERTPFAVETDEDLQERQSSYIDYCKGIDENESRLYNIVNRFVGQALNEFLK